MAFTNSILLSTLLFICLPLNLYGRHTLPSTDTVAIKKAIENAGQYLMSTPINREDVAHIFIILGEKFKLCSPCSVNQVFGEMKHSFYLYDTQSGSVEANLLLNDSLHLKFQAPPPSLKDSLYQYMNLLTMYSMYCGTSYLNSHIPFEQLSRYLNVFLDMGHYLATHALFQSTLLLESNCYPERKVDLTAINERGKLEVTKILNASNPGFMLLKTNDCDIFYESLAFLLLSGQEIDEGLITQVISLQNADGGWSNSTKRLNMSNPHSSLLALWLLLLIIK